MTEEELPEPFRARIVAHEQILRWLMAAWISIGEPPPAVALGRIADLRSDLRKPWSDLRKPWFDVAATPAQRDGVLAEIEAILTALKAQLGLDPAQPSADRD